MKPTADSRDASGALLSASPLPFELPPFADIEVSDLIPAFRTAVVDHAAELRAIAQNPQSPTWENTMDELEAAGEMLRRVLAVVWNYASTMADEHMRRVEETVAGELALHVTNMYFDRELYQRVREVARHQEPVEGSEDAALLRHWLCKFRRGGADLDDSRRQQLRDIDARLAELAAGFSRTLQEQTLNSAVHFTREEELRGVDRQMREALAQAAKEAGLEGWLLHLGLPTVQPILEQLEDSGARARVYAASVSRVGEANDARILEIVRLRARRAELLGYENHAAYVAEEETAGSVTAVRELLSNVTPAAVANAQAEAKMVAEKRQLAAEQAGEIQPASGIEANDRDAGSAPRAAATERTADAGSELREADWPYWDARLREEHLRSNEDELKQYFPLDQVLVDGAFFAAHRLYGIDVVRRADLQAYHPDALVWEVREGQESGGEPIGLLITDLFARTTKRGGAWMSSFVDQNHLLNQPPVVVNVMNIARPKDHQPGEVGRTLLTLNEVTTVFHEFGHALHGLLSDVRYPSLSGTNVPRDFVEFPSQINENWALEPEVLANYARHRDTGELLPDHLVQAVRRQARWGQGFATTEYLGACWLDLAWHSLSSQQAEAVSSVAEFEQQALEVAGIPLTPRYRSAYFNHIFSGGYSADYWSYLWAEVLDADGFQAFVDTDAAQGDIADADAAGTITAEGDAPGGGTAHLKRTIHADDVRFAGDRFRRMILSRGATIDYEEAFWMFRGQQRSVEPLLRRRGLSGAMHD